MKDQEIMLLLNKLRSENISPQELDQLSDLLKSRKDVTALLSHMQLTYEQLVDKTKLQQYAHAELTRNRLLHSIQGEIKPDKVKSKSLLKAWHYAAVVLIIAACAGLFYSKLNTEPDIVWKVVETTAGQKKLLTLADGTRVTLNGNSNFRYADKKTNGLRLVQLAGEAVFDVAKDKEHPFVIISKNFTTQVVGTSFNLDTDIESSVSVTSGLVNVIAIEATQALRELTTQKRKLEKNKDFDLTKWSNNLPQDYAKLTLGKGQKAYLKEDKHWANLPFSDKSWTIQQMALFDEPMNQVMLKLNRSYGISVALSEHILNEHVTITFENKNIEQILNTLAELCNAKLTKSDNNWKITK